MKSLPRKTIFALGAGMIISLSSCEKTVLDDDGEVLKGSAKLTITTRGEDSNDEGIVPLAQVYIFNQAAKCVQILTMEGESNTVMTPLSPGTYTLYSVGGNDLDRFTLPTLSEATTISAITLKEGKVMDSFFSGKSATVTIREADNTNESITLNRVVTCLNKIEIKDVPTDITAIEIKLSPFYNAIQLDGAFLSSPIVDCKVPLTKQSDGTTWKAAPKQLLFPSIGNPTVFMSFTRGNNTETRFYTMSEPMIANHYYNFSSTYKSSQSSLSVTVTTTNWGEDKDIEFDIKDTDTKYLPVAGQYCNGYYVVSVDEQAHKAVLLSEKIAYNAPENQSDATLWRGELEKQMAALEKPAYITSNWRLPTVKEVEIFTKDLNAVSFTEDGYSPVCFCEDGEGNLVWAYTKRENEDYVFNTSGAKTTFASNIRLRPVIDITY